MHAISSLLGSKHSTIGSHPVYTQLSKDGANHGAIQFEASPFLAQDKYLIKLTGMEALCCSLGVNRVHFFFKSKINMDYGFEVPSKYYCISNILKLVYVCVSVY